MYHTSPLDQTDVVFSIFSFLEVYEIAKCSRVCKFWCNLLRAPQSEDFWEKTYNSRYKRFATSIPLDLTSVNWRTRCYRRALADANWSVGSFSKRNLCGGGEHTNDNGYLPCADVFFAYDSDPWTNAVFFVLEPASRGYDEFLLFERHKTDEQSSTQYYDKGTITGGYLKGFCRSLMAVSDKQKSIFGVYNCQCYKWDASTCSQVWEVNIDDILLANNEQLPPPVQYYRHRGLRFTAITVSPQYCIVGTNRGGVYLMDINTSKLCFGFNVDPDSDKNQTVNNYPYRDDNSIFPIIANEKFIVAISVNKAIVIRLSDMKVTYTTVPTLKPCAEPLVETCVGGIYESILVLLGDNSHIYLWNLNHTMSLDTPITIPFYNPLYVVVPNKHVFIVATETMAQKFSVETQEKLFEYPNTGTGINNLYIFENKLGVVCDSLVSFWDWEKDCLLFSIDMSDKITFIQMSYSRVLLGDSSGTISLCDASQFKIGVAMNQPVKVVVIPIDSDFSESSILLTGSRNGKGDLFLRELNSKYLLPNSSRDILIQEDPEFTFFLRGYTTGFQIRMPNELENEELLDLPINEMATLLINRPGTTIYGNAFVYCYQRIENRTYQIDNTINKMNDVFGLLDGFNPAVKSWEPPLHRARSLKIIEGLLAYGAYPDVKDNDGNTPLHVIVGGVNADDLKGSISKLIEAGADVNAENSLKQTPLGLALMNEYYRIGIEEVSNLINKGARAENLFNFLDKSFCDLLFNPPETKDDEAIRRLLSWLHFQDNGKDFHLSYLSAALQKGRTTSDKINKAKFFRMGGFPAIIKELRNNEVTVTQDYRNPLTDANVALTLLKWLMNPQEYQKGGLFSNFHSWIKEKIIREHGEKNKGNCSIMDLACGMGTDMQYALQQCGYKSAIGVDVDLAALWRARETNPNSKLWHADITDARLLSQNDNITVSLITCFYGFQYAFYSKEAATNAIQLISSSLSANGEFVCIIPDPEKITNHAIDTFDHWQVREIEVVGKPVAFQQPYTFMFDYNEWEEYLVDMKFLLTECENRGLKLEQVTRLPRFAEEYTKEVATPNMNLNVSDFYICMKFVKNKI